MGNSLRLVLGNGSPRFPCHLQLGRCAAVDLSTGRYPVFPDGSFWENYSVTYTVNGLPCSLMLSKYVDCYGIVRSVGFGITDSVYFNYEWNELKLSLQTNFPWISHPWDTPGFRSNIDSPFGVDMAQMKTNSTTDGEGNVTDTIIFFYGSGNRGGLLVAESKRNGDNVTVAHYFANSGGSSFNRTETDIGLSVIARFAVLNENLDITETVDGPEQHPASALFYMFDEVFRSRTWKPTMCPHCANARRGRTFWQSDSEESDGALIRAHRATQKNAAIANSGRFKGNANGNFIVTLLFQEENK